jgi:hypothetical protein
MPQALVVTRAFKSGLVGGGFEALAAGTGDALSVPNFTPGSRAWVLEAWGADNIGPADFGLRSPSFHDNTRGLRFAYMAQPSAGKPQLLLPHYVRQPLYPSDVLTVEVSGTAADKAAVNLLSYFEDLPGATQRLLSWAEVESRAVDTVGIFLNPVGAASVDYGATRALNADDDRLKANTDYALLGATSQVACDLLAFTAPETSGRRLGMPLLTRENDSSGWFVDLSNKYSLPLIPVLNANNKGNVLFQCADSAGATTPHVTLILAELG